MGVLAGLVFAGRTDIGLGLPIEVAFTWSLLTAAIALRVGRTKATVVATAAPARAGTAVCP
jgi:hypothetical protein